MRLTKTYKLTDLEPLLPIKTAVFPLLGSFQITGDRGQWLVRYVIDDEDFWLHNYQGPGQPLSCDEFETLTGFKRFDLKQRLIESVGVLYELSDGRPMLKRSRACGMSSSRVTTIWATPLYRVVNCATTFLPVSSW